MGQRRQDALARKAQREGYAARSIFKLEEIDRRLSLFSHGKRVLDLGAAPGSWAQYIAKKVGHTGAVLGIDLQEISLAFPKHVEIQQRDVLSLQPSDWESWGQFDVIVSDMAPSTSGHRFTDQARSHDLFMCALNIAMAVGTPNAVFVAKLFQGPDFEIARAAVRSHFGTVRIIRPKATRSESYEVFVVGLPKKTKD